MQVLFGGVAEVMAQMAMPYADRPANDGARRKVETYDIASVLFRLKTGASGAMMLNRSAWGRKGRIALQIFGSRGSIAYDQERMNEFQLFTADGRGSEQGFRTVLTAPVHAPYDRFIPSPGHGLGFNELKIIECHELLKAIRGEDARVIDFAEGTGDRARGARDGAVSIEDRAWVRTGPHV